METGPTAAPCYAIHLNTEAGIRGGEVQALALASHMQGEGLHCALAARPGGLLDQARSAGVEALPWSALGELDLLAAYRLRAWVRSHRPRIVHAHTAHALTLALLATRMMGGVQVVGSRRVSFPLRSPLSDLKYGAADAVVAVSETVRAGLLARGLRPERVHVIHSGVDLARFRGLPSKREARVLFGIQDQGPVLGVVGALVPHKGHATLLGAVSRMGRAAAGLQIVFAGDGELRGVLERMAAERDLHIRFLGQVQDPVPLYPALDCLALPSLSGEGSPAAIKEAAAAGVPVVATDVGGVGEILRHEEEALLVPPGDEEALGRALARLLSGTNEALQLAARARIRVCEFGMDKMARAHVALYGRLVNGH